jgi:glycosyltransferase involved in cell wall biosynthesis
MRKNNKSICMVVQNYFPEDPRVRKYVNSLIKHNYRVDIISLKRHDLKFIEQYSNGTIYRIGIPKKRSTAFRYLSEYIIFFISSFLFLNLLSLKNSYKIIHIHNMPDFLVFIGLLPKIFGAKIILDMHEITPEFFQFRFNANKKSLMICICIFIEFLSLHFADHIITVTDKIREKLVLRNDLSNIDVIMNTIYYTPDASFKIPNTENFEIIYHGTLTDLYSLDLPLKALSLIKESTKKIRFNIYGDGPSKYKLIKLVEKLELQDIVIFHERISYEEIITILKKMNLGILAFRRNQYIDLSFSNKLSEYINYCIPVLTTKSPAVLDYFCEDDLILCDDSEEGIYKKLLEIIKGNLNIEERVLSAKKKYKKISWDIMEQKYIYIIKCL